MKYRILFVSTANAARSQMAEALLPLIGGDLFVASAGTHPVGLHPMTVSVMDELGINLRDRRSKNVTAFVGQPFDYVITVCDLAEALSLPSWSAQRRHWSLNDPAVAPAEARLNEFRRVRDEIVDRLCVFLINELRIVPAGLRSCSCSWHSG